MGETRRRLALAIIEHLQSEVKDGTITSDMEESVEVAIECLAQCYELDLEDRDSLDTIRVGKNLMEIFSTACSEDLSAADGVQGTGALSDEDKQRAEALKNEGNEYIKQNKFEEALRCYTGAIEIDSQNPIYACNRAVAYLKMQEYEKAVADCERALELDPNYSKAFGRLGFAQMHLNNLEKAKECYEKAMQLDPGNESYSSSLGAVKLRLEAQRRKAEMTQPGPEAEKVQGSSGSSSAPGAVPGPGGLPNMANLSSFFNSPAVMNMAQSVMSNPQLMQMATSFFGNTADTSADTSAAGSGQSPSMDSLFSVGRQMAEQMENDNPELVEQLREQFGGESDAKGHEGEGNNE